MLVEEAEEVLALDEIHLRRLEGFRRGLVGVAGEHGAEAEAFAVLGDARDERLAVDGGDAQLHRAAAEDEDAARRLPLGEQHGAPGIDIRERDGVERQQRSLGQAAEVALRSPLARRAVLEEFEAVGRGPHISPRLRAQDSVLLACHQPLRALEDRDCLEIIIRHDARMPRPGARLAACAGGRAPRRRG